VAELESFYRHKHNPDCYLIPATVTFTHIYSHRTVGAMSRRGLAPPAFLYQCAPGTCGAPLN
jgi:hypothetical protein